METSKKGHLHPLTHMIREIHTIFAELGFEVGLGPELESEYFNFDALNMAEDHPARDMQDTFWLNPLKDRKLLRTHTTNLTARVLKERKDNLPLKMIFPGKVFRNEATDITHEAQFYQIDGVCVGEKISLGDLKGVLTAFFEKLLGEDTEIRFRPSFFSFTEPSVEIDVKFKGKWLEMMGGGIVNPNVFKMAGVDTSKWQGFAFGGGIDRMLMVKYDIDDIRLLYSGDLRFVHQF